MSSGRPKSLSNSQLEEIKNLYLSGLQFNEIAKRMDGLYRQKVRSNLLDICTPQDHATHAFNRALKKN